MALETQSVCDFLLVINLTVSSTQTENWSTRLPQSFLNMREKQAKRSLETDATIGSLENLELSLSLIHI